MTRQCEHCGAMRDNFAAYADGDLSEDERVQVAAVAAACAACADELQVQAAVRRHLQTLRRRRNLPNPPSRIWAGASEAWKQQDGRRLRRTQTRLALIAVCMLMLLFGAVWARLSIPDAFPVNAVLHDFAQARASAPKPAFVTADADQAAQWLRWRINADFPPINLRLSRASLIGADVITVNSHAIGRLLYRTTHGLVGVYIAPGGTEFGDLPERSAEGEVFRLASDHKAISLYGWSVAHNGYAVMLPQSDARPLIGAIKSLLIEAENGTHQTSH